MTADEHIETASQQATLTLSFGGPTAHTKGSETTEKTVINSIQVFVFKGDSLDGYAGSDERGLDSLRRICVNATVGVRDIWALANAPDLSGCRTKASLLSAISHFRDNVTPELVMSGHLDNQTINVTYEGDISLRRYCACIRIDKITRNMGGSSFGSVKFQLKRAYVTNAVSGVSYDLSSREEGWINPSMGEDRNMDVKNTMLCQSFSGTTTLVDGQAYTKPVTLYVYPNPFDKDDDSLTQSYKRTRLVIECRMDINGDGYYGNNEYFTYPVIIGSLAANHFYDIRNLTLTRPGNTSNGDDVNDDGEDEEIEPVTAQFNIEVTEWTDISMGRVNL